MISLQLDQFLISSAAAAVAIAASIEPKVDLVQITKAGTKLEMVSLLFQKEHK